MIPKPMDQITETDFSTLSLPQLRNAKPFDYKQQFPEFNDAGKKRVAGECSSFANTAGGDLNFRDDREALAVPTGTPGGKSETQIKRFCV